MKKLIFYPIVCLIILTGAHALLINKQDIKAADYTEGTLEYKINITNNDLPNINFYINPITLNEFGSIVINPSHLFTLNKGDSQVIDLIIHLSKDVAPGRYLSNLLITALNNASLKEYLTLSFEVLRYESRIESITVSAPDKVDPRKPFNIDINISALNDFYPTMLIYVSSDKAIIASYNSSLILKKGHNNFTRSIVLDTKAEYGVYNVVVTLSEIGSVIAQNSTSIEVLSYESITPSFKDEGSIFGRTIVKSVLNNGTYGVNASIMHELNFIDSLFITSVSSNAVINGTVITKTVYLLPGEEASLIIGVSYIPLLIAPFIIIFLFIILFVLTRSVVVTKELISIYKEGDKTFIKLVIAIKNVSIKTIKQVRVMDKIPMFIKGVGKFGTIKGELDKEHRLVSWEINELKPKDEMIIPYSFMTNVEVMGEAVLPPCRVVFKEGKRRKEAVSNILVLEQAITAKTLRTHELLKEKEHPLPKKDLKEIKSADKHK